MKKQKSTTLAKKFVHKCTIDKNYHKVREHCCYTNKYRVAVHNTCNLKYSIATEIPMVFHNELKYDYHFIIKELANKSEGKFNCLRENNGKQNLFSSNNKIS